MGEEIKDFLKAASEGNQRVIRFYISQRGVNLNQASEKNGIAALHLAAQNGHLGIVNVLIEAGVNVNVKTKSGITALCFAAQNGHYEIVKALCSHQETKVSQTAFILAAKFNHIKIVEFFLSRGFKSDNEAIFLEWESLKNSTIQSESLINLLEKHYSATDSEKILSLQEAIEGDYLSLIEGDYLSLIEGDYLSLIEGKVKEGYNVNHRLSNGAPLIFLAISKGYNFFEILVKHGADIHQKDRQGACALFVAAQCNKPDVLTELLEQGALVNDTCHNGATALHSAAQHGHIECAEILISNNININATLKNGATAFFVAAQNGHIPMVNLLIKNKADINQKLLSGISPLLIAIENGHFQVVRAMMKAKVDVSVITQEIAQNLLSLTLKFVNFNVLQSLQEISQHLKSIWSDNGRWTFDSYNALITIPVKVYNLEENPQPEQETDTPFELKQGENQSPLEEEIQKEQEVEAVLKAIKAEKKKKYPVLPTSFKNARDQNLFDFFNGRECRLYSSRKDRKM